MRTPFGLRLYEARKRAKLTQQEVCRKLGISQGTLSELENSAHSSGHTAELGKLYGRDAHYLSTGEGHADARPQQQNAEFSSGEIELIIEFRRMLLDDKIEMAREITTRASKADKIRREVTSEPQMVGWSGAMPLDDKPIVPANKKGKR